jgi:pimeloyl-ACP methyl ester carboxylesterase
MKKLIPLVLGRYINTMAYIAPDYAARFGFRLFCYPARPSLKPYHRTFLDSAKHSVIEHRGVSVKVYKWNNGPKKVLFLHGWQSHTYRWKSYIENFSPEEYTVYSIDAPGHGLSSGSFLTVPLYSEVVEKFLKDHGDVEAIISHSIGSFTTLYTLYRLPLLPVKKLVLLAPPGEASEFFDFYKRTLRLNKRASDLVLKHFERVIEEPVEFFSASRFAENLPHPGLIIHDRQDEDTSYEHSVSINKAWKRSRLRITDGLAHNLKSPDIVKEVSDFVRQNNHHEVAV